MSEAPPAKRPKIGLACQECRQRKVRCDGGRPLCNGCSRKRLKCIYLDSTMPEYVRLIERRNRDLEGALEGSTSPGAPPGSLSATHEHTRQVSTDDISISPKHRRMYPMPSSTSLATRIEDPGVSHSVTMSSDPGSSHDPSQNPLEGRRVSSSFPTSQHPVNKLHHSEIPSHGRDSAIMRERSTMGIEGTVNGDSLTTSAYLGQSSAAAFLQEVVGKSPRRRPSNDVDNGDFDAPASSEPSVTPMSLPNSAAKRDSSASGQLVLLPPRHVADVHLQSYWTKLYPFNPILHHRTFNRRYESIWSQHSPTIGAHSASKAVLEDVDSIDSFHALVNILMALGALYPAITQPSAAELPSDVTRPGHIYFQRAEAIIARTSTSQRTLMSVQVYVLMAHYLHTTDMVDKCWVTLGIAIRLAQGCRIHVEHAKESQAEQQERRRTWAYCVQMDRILAMIYGRPPMTSWPCDHPAPQVANDDALLTDPYSAQVPIVEAKVSLLGFFVHSVRYCDVLLEVLKSERSPPHLDGRASDGRLFSVENSNRLLVLDGALADWRNQLPDYLIVQADDDLQGNSVMLSQSIAMLCRYLHLRMLLFRPALVEVTKYNMFGEAGPMAGQQKLTELQRAVLQGCVCSCISAAQDIVKTIHARCVRNQNPLPNWWYTTFYIFTAGTAILAVMLSPDTQRILPERGESLQIIWTRAMEIFAVYEQQGCRSARRCAKMLQKSLNQGTRNTEVHVKSKEDVRNHTGSTTHMSSRPEDDFAAARTAISPQLDEVAGMRDDWTIPDDWWQAAGMGWLNDIDPMLT